MLAESAVLSVMGLLAGRQLVPAIRNIRNHRRDDHEPQTERRERLWVPTNGETVLVRQQRARVTGQQEGTPVRYRVMFMAPRMNTQWVDRQEMRPYRR